MIEELSELSGAIPNKPVRDWKNQGKKVIGFMYAYVPEERDNSLRSSKNLPISKSRTTVIIDSRSARKRVKIPDFFMSRYCGSYKIALCLKKIEF